MAAVLEVGGQLGVGLVQDLNALVDEEQRKHILYPVGHVQDVGYLGTGRGGAIRVVYCLGFRRYVDTMHEDTTHINVTKLKPVCNQTGQFAVSTSRRLWLYWAAPNRRMCL